MEWNFQQLFTPQPIMGITINTVFLHPVVRSSLFILIALVLLVGTIVFITRNDRIALAFKKSLVIAFFTSGLAYALYADIGWTAWLTRDFKTYAGLGTDEKLLRMDGGIYDFSRAARNIIHDDYMVFSTDDYAPLRIEYFLLPLRKRTEADYIIVIGDKLSHYDQAKNIFTRGDITIPNVEMVLPYARDAYILKRRSS